MQAELDAEVRSTEAELQQMLEIHDKLEGKLGR